jgi:hypothetical protein
MARLSRAERDTAAKIFRFLVTPDGSKIAYTVPSSAPQGAAARSIARAISCVSFTKASSS